MKFLKKLVKPLVRFALKLKAKQIISRLRSSSDPYQKMLGDSLKETLENDITEEEKVWKDKIELLKNKLESSSDKISFIDYGAGNNPNRSEEHTSELQS